MDTGTIAWVIISTAMVLLMTPGVAFFYGGLVKMTSVVSMMMLSFGAMGLVAGLWILYGYNMSVAASPGDFAGNPFSDFGLSAMAASDTSTPDLLGVAFGAMVRAMRPSSRMTAPSVSASGAPWMETKPSRPPLRS